MHSRGRLTPNKPSSLKSVVHRSYSARDSLPGARTPWFVCEWKKRCWRVTRAALVPRTKNRGVYSTACLGLRQFSAAYPCCTSKRTQKKSPERGGEGRNRADGGDKRGGREERETLGRAKIATVRSVLFDCVPLLDASTSHIRCNCLSCATRSYLFFLSVGCRKTALQ